jgi:hypothetical protein
MDSGGVLRRAPATSFPGARPCVERGMRAMAWEMASPGTRTSSGLAMADLTSRETPWMGRMRRPQTGRPHGLRRGGFADTRRVASGHLHQWWGQVRGGTPSPPSQGESSATAFTAKNNLQQVLDLLPDWIYLGPARFLRRIPPRAAHAPCRGVRRCKGRGGSRGDVAVAGRAAWQEVPRPGQKNFPHSIRGGGRWPWMEASSSWASGIHNYVGAMFHAWQ